MKILSITILCMVLCLVCNSQATVRSGTIEEDNVSRYDGPIIDMHIHAFADGNPLFGLTHPPTMRGDTFEGVKSAAEQKEATFRKFRKHNIVKAMVGNGQLWYAEDPETILVGGSNPPATELKKQYDDGLLHVIGEMAPFYRGVLADDPALEPYFELAQELDIPVGFHIFPGGPNYGVHRLPQMLGGMRVYNANPLQLESVLIKFPDLKLYIMHGGWPYVHDIKALMYAHPNLYVDIAVVKWILPREKLYSYLQTLLSAGFGDRIMFGSDQMVWPQTIDIGIETLNSADFLSLEQKEDIFYDNAARFLGLSDEEIAKHKRK